MHQRAILITRAPVSNNRVQKRRIIIIIAATGAVFCTQAFDREGFVLIARSIVEAVGMVVVVGIGTIEPEAQCGTA